MSEQEKNMKALRIITEKCDISGFIDLFSLNMKNNISILKSIVDNNYKPRSESLANFNWYMGDWLKQFNSYFKVLREKLIKNFTACICEMDGEKWVVLSLVNSIVDQLEEGLRDD